MCIKCLFLMSSRSVTIVRAFPTKPNTHRTETSTTSTDNWKIWKASTTDVSVCHLEADGGHRAKDSIKVKLYVAFVLRWNTGVNGGNIISSMLMLFTVLTKSVSDDDAARLICQRRLLVSNNVV